MDRLVKLISNASSTRASDDDDFADRLSSRYTVVLLVTFAVLIGTRQYVRNPITCWTPNHFTRAHSTYTSNYCWIKNTYYLPWQSELPPPNDGHREVAPVPPDDDPMRYAKRQEVPYYQWVPFILLGQVSCWFELP
jgi:innexin